MERGISGGIRSPMIFRRAIDDDRFSFFFFFSYSFIRRPLLCCSFSASTEEEFEFLCFLSVSFFVTSDDQDGGS